LRIVVIDPGECRPRTRWSVQILAAVPDKVASFAVYRQTTGTDDGLIVAPALDVYPVIVESPRAGTRHGRGTSCSKGRPVDPLEPPAGAPVIRKAEAVRVARVPADRSCGARRAPHAVRSAKCPPGLGAPARVKRPRCASRRLDVSSPAPTRSARADAATLDRRGVAR
jgi:hypothetical protein